MKRAYKLNPQILAAGGSPRSKYQFHRSLPPAAMKFVALLFSFGISTASAGPVTSFDDIQYWIGTGANQAALALDWNGNSTLDNSLVWGFRWDGAAKGIDMLTAIVAADDRLYAKMGSIGSFGMSVVGIGYDANNDGEFALDDDTFFDEHGISNEVPSEGSLSVDPNDWYAEGWFVTGYWQYSVATGNPFNGGAWAWSGTGVSSRDVLNGSWHGLAYAPNFGIQSFARNPLAAEPPSNADFDGDGDVDGRDFLIWQRGFGISSGATPTDGDANGDGAVDKADLEFWQAQYGTPNLLSTAYAVPEPSTGLLFISFIATLTRWTHPRRMSHEIDR